ncbi:RING-H2 finger protein ATL2-like [Dendrobium catenatum]|uniref:RING-type E3 ubiquitin transferase n=1 Tax=Dendrobium catenatum TaxID=906689 RepID=A0A2I0VHF2_9ASPA|nr:RING-H2 finger protein ATL2-like [Dendrobium catenatum]PKU62846.1 RING-H2 finger protein ATL2 [Dendrobium catenatum]
MDPHSEDGKSPQSYALSGNIMLSAIVVLFTVVLLILFLHLCVRWNVIRRASRQARRRRGLVFAREGQTAPPCAVNRGLDPSILGSFPVLLFSDYAGEGQDDELAECAVCLNKFKDGEKIRCLPPCSHRFHIDCIDMWFYSHSTCPLCRAAVEVVKDVVTTTSGARPAVDTVDALVDLDLNELRLSYERVEEMGSSSSDSGFLEVMIDIPASRAESSSGQEEQISSGLESPDVQPLKSAGRRMVLIRWLLMRNRRFYWGGGSGSEADLERGDGESPPVTTAADPTR